MNALMMIVAFLVLTGIALIYCDFIKMNLMEGMFMAALTVVILLHITTMIRVSFLGVFILVITAVAGYVLTTGLSLGQLVLKKHNSVQRILNSGIGAYVALAVIFLISMFVNYGDYIRNIDELHLWALVPKYMLEHGRLPIKAWRLDQNLGTCYFNYFFQAIAGYNEGMMYASAALLHWIGFLLPFGVAFMLPVFIYITTKIGLTTPEMLVSKRKFVILAIFIFAAILTPPDMVSQVLLGVPMLLLYEVGIVVSRLVKPAERA